MQNSSKLISKMPPKTNMPTWRKGKRVVKHALQRPQQEAKVLEVNTRPWMPLGAKSLSRLWQEKRPSLRRAPKQQPQRVRT